MPRDVKKTEQPRCRSSPPRRWSACASRRIDLPPRRSRLEWARRAALGGSVTLGPCRSACARDRACSSSRRRTRRWISSARGPAARARGPTAPRRRIGGPRAPAPHAERVAGVGAVDCRPLRRFARARRPAERFWTPLAHAVALRARRRRAPAVLPLGPLGTQGHDQNDPEAECARQRAASELHGAACRSAERERAPLEQIDRARPPPARVADGRPPARRRVLQRADIVARRDPHAPARGVRRARRADRRAADAALGPEHGARQLGDLLGRVRGRRARRLRPARGACEAHGGNRSRWLRGARQPDSEGRR